MSDFSSLSTSAQSLYIDLRSSLEDDEASNLIGNLIEFEIRGRVYLYDQFRLGGKEVKRYIGPKTEESTSRFENINALKEMRKHRREERSRTLKKLRAEGVLTPDMETGKVLSGMARSGVFRLGGVLVGTNAFRLYELELGARFMADDSVSTRDIDIAGFERFSFVVEDKADPELNLTLKNLGYNARLGLDQAQAWRWQNTSVAGSREVEFLTPSFEEDEGVKFLPSLGVHAQSLHYMNFLIRDPLKVAALYRDGVLVQVPRPERYAVHKLIVADRRSDRSPIKARKDLRQASLLIQILMEVRPTDLQMAFEEAMAEGPAWKARVKSSLDKMPSLKKELLFYNE
jgi:hypothetical protein